MRIKIQQELSTNTIEIAEGVSQGETLSPLLFDLFMAHLESFLKERGGKGVDIGEKNIQLLANTDDILRFSKTIDELRGVLEVTSKYFEENQLGINVKKTNIVKFRKAGKGKRKDPLFMGSEQVEVVKEYNKIEQWDKIMLLYNSLVCSNLMYGIEVWGMEGLEILERLQLQFFKRLLHLQTPNYTASVLSLSSVHY